MGQGRHTLRSINDHVYPRPTSERYSNHRWEKLVMKLAIDWSGHPANMGSYASLIVSNFAGSKRYNRMNWQATDLSVYAKFLFFGIRTVVILVVWNKELRIMYRIKPYVSNETLSLHSVHIHSLIHS